MKEAHEEVNRLEGEVQALQRLFMEAQGQNEALERGNRENQRENVSLHSEIQRSQANAARQKKK